MIREMKTITDSGKIEELLSRGVEKIYPGKEELRKILVSGKRLRLYQGFDPTGTKLHLGHMVGLRKLAAWQEMGHEVIFLIGDGTGQAGDPSGKTSAREKFHTRQELRENAKNYIEEVSPILKFDGKNPAKVLYNGDWLNEALLNILNIAEHFSLSQLAERDLFQERIKKGGTVNMKEFLYPLLQGYDSVHMDVDLEIGGSDQTFNMLCGRTLLKSMKGKEKFVMTTPLLADKSGRKIGKTEGNIIALDDAPGELFGKIMALPDEVIVQCFECLTTAPMEKVRSVAKAISLGDNPMVHKKELAEEIVRELNNDHAAKEAAAEFSATFQKRETPEDMPEVLGKGSLIETFVAADIVSSKTEFRRLIQEGAIENLEARASVENVNERAVSGTRYKIGKKRFVRIK
ncbi:MAG: tyrosine--tRNA ligase [Patescibacteria group bacterium]